MTSVHITCPFPPCVEQWTIGIDPWQSRVTVPFHYPSGFEGAERYADLRCPGAMAMYDCSTRDLALDAQSAEQVNRAYENYLLWLAKSHDEQAAEREQHAEAERLREQLDAEQRAEEERSKRADYLRSLSPHLRAPIGRPADPDRDETYYFPVKARPDDGPQPGEPPHAPVPEGVDAIHLTGRDAVDDSHAATVGLTRLALQQHGQAQEALSVVTELLERATAMAAVAETHVQSANSLVISAVGTGAGKPPAAEQMAEQTALATDTMSSSDGGNLHNAINLAKIRAETANQQIAAATAHGQAYIGLLGG